MDVLRVDAPRAGRLEISVGPVLDSRAWPWNKSALAIDPVLNVYDANGTHLMTVDADNPAATDRASIQMTAAGRLLVRIHNYTPNGNRRAYALTDRLRRQRAHRGPCAGSAPTAPRSSPTTAPSSATFSEPVTGVSGSTFQLRDGTALSRPPSRTTPPTRRATLRPSAPLAGERSVLTHLTPASSTMPGTPLARVQLAVHSPARRPARSPGRTATPPLPR